MTLVANHSVDAQRMASRLAKFPRYRLNAGPTPIESLDNLAKALGQARILVKRDDCTSFALGGNKVRQTEFIFGDILSKGADTVLASSATQSNHLRVLSAAAAKAGIACHVQREHRVPDREPNYYSSGNVLLQNLFGCHAIDRHGPENDPAVDAFLNDLAAKMRTEGRRPYVICASTEYPPFPALGYVDCALEVFEQLGSMIDDIGTIVVPTGSASTHAGLLVGLRALGVKARILGICVRRSAAAQAERVLLRVRQLSEMVDYSGQFDENDIWVSDLELAPGYGVPSSDVLDAISLGARCEGFVTDPVYSGKALSGLIRAIRNRDINPTETVMLIHTGGLPAIFAYHELLQL